MKPARRSMLNDLRHAVRRTCLYLGLLSAAAGSLLLTGCKLGPDYARPEPVAGASVPARFTESTDTNGVFWQPAKPAAHLPRGEWWAVFQDTNLSRLEILATTRNQDLAVAAARFEEARAQLQITRADQFPQVDLQPSYTRQRSSYNTPQNGAPAKIGPTFNTFTAQLNAGWEPDLWGRVRRQVESARAQLEASADDRESLKLSVQAELAMQYLALRSAQYEVSLIEQTIAAYQHSLELTLHRRHGGIASDLDVSQAQTQLRTAEADLPGLRLKVARLSHAIAVLCGAPPEGFEVGRSPTRAQPPIVPEVLTSVLLERRPDIAAAEKRMTAANARIGVAKSAFYPRLRLNGLAGFQSVSASSWFEWPSRFWSVGPAVDLPLFTGGRNQAGLTYARAAYEESAASYRRTVLAAFQEVEDQLAAEHWLEDQFRRQQAALESARQTLQIANNRYQAGLTTYLEVATAQGTALNLERGVVHTRSDMLAASVGLIRALGGAWETE